MQSNAYFLAKFRFDTAENEPAKNLPNFAKKNAKFANSTEVPARRVPGYGGGERPELQSPRLVRSCPGVP